MRSIIILLALLGLCPGAYGQETLVYETDSLYHHIIVSETAEVRVLRFHKGTAASAMGSSFAQSAILLADPYELHMSYSRYTMAGAGLVEEPKHALFIGLGAGTLPKVYARAFPDCQVDVAELDGEVVKVARRFFFLPELPNMKITVMDGRLFVRQAEVKYDFILLDAYRDEMIPFHLMTKEFLEQLKTSLAPGGVLVSNIAIQRDKQLYPWMKRTYQSVFPTLLEAQVTGSINRVLICMAEDAKLSELDLVSRAHPLAQKMSLPFDLSPYAAAYGDASSKRPSTKVLTDDYAPVNLMRIRKADEKDWEY